MIFSRILKNNTASAGCACGVSYTSVHDEPAIPAIAPAERGRFSRAGRFRRRRCEFAQDPIAFLFRERKPSHEDLDPLAGLVWNTIHDMLDSLAIQSRFPSDLALAHPRRLHRIGHEHANPLGYLSVQG